MRADVSRTAADPGRRNDGGPTTTGSREVTVNAWWSQATMLPFAGQNGGAYNGGPFRGAIQTTEVKTYTSSTTTYYGHRNPPHFIMLA